MTFVGGGKIRGALERAGNLLVITRRWMEPQRSPACLSGIPDRNHLLRINDRLALSLRAFCLSRWLVASRY